MPSSDRPPPIDEPPVKRERNAVETKKRLLDAAEHEFATKGFAGARLRDVALAAGVQQALIHHYFDDKDRLYAAVLDRAIAEAAAGSWSILSSVTGSRALLEAFVDLLVRFYDAHSNLLSILRLEAASGASPALEAMRNKTRPLFEAVEKVVAQLQRDSAVRADLPPADVIVAVLSLVVFPSHERALLHALGSTPVEGATAELRKRVVTTILLDGVLAPK